MRAILIIFILIVARPVIGQLDTIVQKNGLKSPVKIVSMDAKCVRFILPGEYAGNVNSIKSDEINYVIMASGSIALPAEQKSKGAVMPEFTNNIEFVNNYAGVNLSQLIYTTVGFNYRYITDGGGLSVKASLNFNLSPIAMKNLNYSIAEFNPAHRKYTAGIEFDLFPFYQRKIAYFIGPAFQIGGYDYFAHPTGCTGNCPQERFNDGMHFSFIVNNGMLIRFNENFFADISSGFGVQRNQSPNYGTLVRLRGAFQFTLGYGF